MKKIVRHIKKHRWDETLVISVMVTAGLCLLILLASYLTTVGKAYSALPSSPGLIGVLGACKIFTGSTGPNTAWERGTNCQIVCNNAGETNILAFKENKLINSKDKIGGMNIKEKYNCVCCSPERVLASPPPPTAESKVQETVRTSSATETRCKVDAMCSANQKCSNGKCVEISPRKTESSETKPLEKELQESLPAYQKKCNRNTECDSGRCNNGFCA